jgi:hypothetical protein
MATRPNRVPSARAVLLVLAFASLAVVPCSGQTNPTDDLASKLSARIPEYRLEGVTFLEALLRVAADFQLRMGIAWVNTPAAHTTHSFYWHDVTVQEIVTAIADSEPGYSLRTAGSVVHVSSNMILANQNFLLIRIPEFAMRQQPVELAELRLKQRIRQIVSRSKRLFPESALVSAGEPKLDLDLTNVTVEEILDALITSSPRQVWLASFTNPARLTPSGFHHTFQIESWLVNPDEQPVWKLLRWTEPVHFGHMPPVGR